MHNKRPTWCHLLFYFTSYVLNMFRTLIHQPSGACDYSVELPHWSYCSWFDACWNFGVVGLEWYPCCRHPTKNNTTNVVIQQNSRKILMMDILMSETCWAHETWNKVASDIKLVFYSSTIKNTVIWFYEYSTFSTYFIWILVLLNFTIYMFILKSIQNFWFYRSEKWVYVSSKGQ